MSDSRRQYRAIKKAVKQLYPEEPKGNLARHLETLVSGIIASKSCQLSKIASKVAGAVHPASREKQLSRWVKNENITFGLYFLPFVQPLLERLVAVRPLALIMDGSAVARGEKGHFPTEIHLALVREVKLLVPETAEVIFLGDGEFDSPELQAEVAAYDWEYVCRTAKNIQIGVDEAWLSLADLAVTRGQRVFRKGVRFTKAAYGPVTVIAWWGARYKEPIYLVSNMTSVQRACDWYRKRMRIETFFSDQKSRGFHLDRSHLSDPDRVQRLMFAACLAYVWVIYLGTVAQQDGWLPVIHRRHRCDLSLFQLGLRLLDYLLNHDRPIPSSFALEPETVR